MQGGKQLVIIAEGRRGRGARDAGRPKIRGRSRALRSGTGMRRPPQGMLQDMPSHRRPGHQRKRSSRRSRTPRSTCPFFFLWPGPQGRRHQGETTIVAGTVTATSSPAGQKDQGRIEKIGTTRPREAAGAHGHSWRRVWRVHQGRRTRRGRAQGDEEPHRGTPSPTRRLRWRRESSPVVVLTAPAREQDRVLHRSTWRAMS